VLAVFGFGDVVEHDFADLFRVELFDVDDDEGHQELPGLDDHLGRQFIVGDPERFQAEERVKSLVDHDATIVDLVIDDVGFLGGMQNQSYSGNQDKDSRNRIAENESYGGQGQCNNADGPIPVGAFFGMEMFGSVPGDERFGGHRLILTQNIT